jgi:hypothetical protein
MLELFDEPWESLSPEILRTWLTDAGEEGVTWEAKADDDKGRLHIDSVRKAASALANQIGGYILLGAKWDKKQRTWSLPGVTLPDPEPETWIGKAMRALQPVPRHQVQTWLLPDGRLVAVVWVDPIDVPPCMTPQGRIYERVSGETLPVTDPALLDRLQRRGDNARARAEQFADRNITRALGFVDWSAERAVGLAVALAPVGRETDDIGSRLFTHSFRTAIVEAVWRLCPGGQPGDIEPRQEQDAFTVAAHFDERHILHASGAVHRQEVSSWLLQATWDGTLTASASFSAAALIGNELVDGAIQRGWTELVPLVERLGGYGPAHLTVGYLVTQPDDRDGAPPLEDQPLPPTGGTFARLPAATWIRRHTTVAPPTEEDLASVDREFQRAAGIETYEAEPGPGPDARADED